MKIIVNVLFFLVVLIMACGGDQKSTSSSKAASSANKSAQASAGKKEAGNRKGKLVYKQYCVICHGADGKLAVSGATDLSQSTISMEERITQITNGKGLMTPYKDILSKGQIEAVSEYLDELKD